MNDSVEDEDVRLAEIDSLTTLAKSPAWADFLDVVLKLVEIAVEDENEDVRSLTSLTASLVVDLRVRNLQKRMTDARYAVLIADSAFISAGVSFPQSVSKIVKMAVEDEDEDVRLIAVNSLTSLAKTSMYIRYVE